MRYFFVLFLSFLSIQAFPQCIKGNCINGEGLFIFPSGGKYSGQFKDAKLNGQGTFYYTNGNVYTGSWKNNLREGTGQLEMPTGDKYTGEFKANKFWGKGTYTYQGGEYYTGQWYNDNAKGYGKYVFASGEEYNGDFDNGKFHGYGVYKYVNLEIYEGNWSHNKRHGKGVLIKSDGTVQSGIWEDDEFKIPSEVSFKERKNTGDVDLKRDCNRTYCKEGTGFYIYKDGSKWTGEFADGKPNGTGECYYSNGNRYEGKWENNVPHGNGIMFLKNGEVYEGYWENGNLTRKVENNYTEQSEEIENVPKNSDSRINIWALIIGIGAYNHMPALKYTDDDAYQVFAFLRSPEGGMVNKDQINLLIDERASMEGIRHGLDQLVKSADQNDVIIIYFAGHGLKGAFVPYDYDGQNNLISHNEILASLSRSNAKHKVLIADACHSGSMIAQRAPFSEALEEYYSDFEQTSGGTALIMSSKENENSLEFAGMRQGVFSYYLLDGLSGKADYNKNGIVEISELFDFVKTNVRKYTQNNQNPVISGDYDPKMPLGNVRNH